MEERDVRDLKQYILLDLISANFPTVLKGGDPPQKFFFQGLIGAACNFFLKICIIYKLYDFEHIPKKVLL